MRRPAWSALTIRFRLGAALAIALLPVLLLGAAQSALAFRIDADARKASLLAAAERSVVAARTRVQNAGETLRTLAPEALDFQCSPRLGDLLGRAQGYANLIRFDAAGQVVCSSRPAQPGALSQAWLARLSAGEASLVATAPRGVYADEPVVVSAVRQAGPDGRFDGALAAVIPVSSLQPDLADERLPDGAEAALVDAGGTYLFRSAPGGFAPAPAAVEGSPPFYRDRDSAGAARVFASASLVGSDVRLVLSAPSPGLFSWARLNPLSTVLLPLAAFLVALGAVWVVAERVVIHWLQYLERIAAIYAKGRFTVRSRQAERAPPEIRELGHALDAMADAITARDQTLHENLAQKDGLMREIHHRVKNNLQVISSLLNMQQRSLTDPAARAAISDTRQRISAIALIYRALYQGADLKTVDLGVFLEELTAQLLAGEAPSARAIRTELDADALIIDPDKLAPVALFAVEAISNAQKHAFVQKGGLLRVRFKLHGDEACLEIADEGGGAGPATFRDGVGKTLMTAFARQLRGRSEVVANASGGVTARLLFPNPAAPPPGAAAPAPAAGDDQAAA